MLYRPLAISYYSCALLQLFIRVLPKKADPEGNPKSKNENVNNINFSNNCGKYSSCTVLYSMGIFQLSRFHYNIIFRVLTDILSCVMFSDYS